MRQSRIQHTSNDSNARESRLLANLDRTERLLNELDDEVSPPPALEFSQDDIELIYIRNLVRFIRNVIRESDDQPLRAAHASEKLSRQTKSHRNRFRGHGFSAQ